MSDKQQKSYTNGEITVVWQPESCIHSKLCWKGLIEVFNPQLRPWINMKGASSNAIIAQVDQCPSGALSYFKNSENNENEEVASESIVELVKDGPLLVYGNISLKDSEGQLSKKHKVTAFCRCGASANKPYCDGTHRKTGFTG